MKAIAIITFLPSQESSREHQGTEMGIQAVTSRGTQTGTVTAMVTVLVILMVVLMVTVMLMLMLYIEMKDTRIQIIHIRIRIHMGNLIHIMTIMFTSLHVLHGINLLGDKIPLVPCRSVYMNHWGQGRKGVLRAG
jgi:hypothetical protein